MMKRNLIVLALLLSVGCARSSPPAAAPSLADTLEIRCDGATTEVFTSEVQAASDGVRVLVHNTSGEPIFTQWEGGGDSGGDVADAGDRDLTLLLLPGDARFRCLPDTRELDPGVPGGWASFRVIAPEGWIDPALGCDGPVSQGVVDYAAGATGVEDPLRDAQEQAPDGARVSQAGYATPDVRTFVAETEGVVGHTFEYVSDGQGGWLLSQTGSCA